MIDNSPIIQLLNRSSLRGPIGIIIILIFVIKNISSMILGENRVIQLFYLSLLYKRVEDHLYDIWSFGDCARSFET